jgi:hypothetical protein
VAESVEYTDRYDEQGKPCPTPWTVCKGPCQGIGLFPIHIDEWLERGQRTGEVLAVIPQVAEDAEPPLTGIEDFEPFPPPDG